jgi:hypothetical protein
MYRGATTPPVVAPAFDGDAKAAPDTGPDDEPRRRPKHVHLRATRFNLKQRYEFEVGKLETHEVVLEEERPLLLAGLRPQVYRVFFY